MKTVAPNIVASFELSRFLTDNRQKTVNYLLARFTDLASEDVEDIYQEASITLFLKIKNGEMPALTSSLYSYFLSICVHQALNKVNRSGRFSQFDDNFMDSDIEPVQDNKFEELESLVGYDIVDEQTDQEYLNWIEQQVREGVRQMKPPCNQILWSFYWDGLSHRTIADMFGMKSEDVSKTQANRCKHKFSDFIKKVIASYER